MEISGNSETYKATRLWNEVILAFRTGMPLKKHRHFIRNYDNCFTASDCTSWLNCYLKNNPNFGPDVTRQQTMQLLQKFLKCHVIECLSAPKKSTFCDDSQLYKFVQYTPPKVNNKSSLQYLLRTPLAARNSNSEAHVQHFEFSVPNYSTKFLTNVIDDSKSINKNEQKYSEIPSKEQYPECHIFEKKISVKELENLWKAITVKRLETLIEIDSIDAIIDLDVIDGRCIMHNVNRISKAGVVILLDKTEDIPHWVISAMKCLANWPNASGSGSCLPKYPGFEKDVFNVVKDFFINSGNYLIPFSLQQLIFASFKKTVKWNTSFYEPLDEPCSYEYSSYGKNEQRTLSSIVTPDCVTSHNTAFIHTAEGKILLDDAEAMWENPLTMTFETEFTAASPVTRIVPNDSKIYLDAFDIRNSYSLDKVDSKSTISTCASQETITSVLTDDLDTAALNTTAVSNCTLSNIESNLNLSAVSSKSTSLPNIDYLDNTNEIKTSASYLDGKISSTGNFSKEISSNLSMKMHKNIYSSFNDIHSLKSLPVLERQKEKLNRTIAAASALSHIHENSALPVPNLSNSYKTHNKIENDQSLEALQIALLLLPAVNRRHLHMLIKMMNKIIKNDKLILSSNVPIKQCLIETFLPAVIPFDDKSSFSKTVAYQLFSLLIDEGEILFQPPVSLKEEVECRLNTTYTKRIKYTLDDSCILTYCELVSQQQYEEQKVSISKAALFDLLEKIIDDKDISEKARKKKIKQFKESHPEIYYERFPSLQKKQSRSHKPLLPRFLSLRL